MRQERRWDSTGKAPSEHQAALMAVPLIGTCRCIYGSYIYDRRIRMGSGEAGVEPSEARDRLRSCDPDLPRVCDSATGHAPELRRDLNRRRGRIEQHDPLKHRDRTDWARVERLTDAEIEEAVASDPDAAPILTEEWFRQAQVMPPLIKKGVFLRLDPDVVAWFKAEEA